MFASWPAAGSTHAFFQLFLSTANSAFSRLLSLSVDNPADEFITR
jgi:hypothetical protein